MRNRNQVVIPMDENVNTGSVEPTSFFGEKVSGEDHFQKGPLPTNRSCSSCDHVRSIIAAPLLHRGQPFICRVDPSQVVVIDVPVYHAPYLGCCHLCRVHFVELLLFQRRKKALHSRVVVAFPGPAHTLYRVVFGQCFAKYSARILAASIAVEYHPRRSRFLTGYRRSRTQLHIALPACSCPCDIPRCFRRNNRTPARSTAFRLNTGPR